MHAILVTVSSLLVICAFIVYMVAIWKGEARPHRTTRFVVLLIEALTTATLFAQGNTTAIWLAGVFTLSSIVIFILSLKNGMGGWAKADILCLVIALVGIILWKVTANPLTGLFFSILADFAGCVPTFIKTYKYPHTEVWTFYVIGFAAVVINMMAIEKWTVGEFAYPLYILLVDLAMIILILRKDIQKKLL
jgi:hypothetical protein